MTDPSPSLRSKADPVDGSTPWRLTLSATFFWLTAGTLLTVGVLLWAFLAASRRSILDSADGLRRAAAQRIETAVARDLGVAGTTAQSFGREARIGVIDIDDPAAVERTLFARLVDNPTLSEVAFARANALGWDAQGNLVVAPDGRWELGAYRTAGSPGVFTRRTERRNGIWTATVVERTADGPFAASTAEEAAPTRDPTERATFEVAAARAQAGRPLWSDLHWSELDSGAQRRIVMTVQQAVFTHGAFAGVVRVGLLTEQIDRLTRVRVDEANAADPHRIFLCDAQGRLLGRLGPQDRLELSGDDLRFVPTDPPPEVMAALSLPLLSRVHAGTDVTSDLVVGGRRYLATFRGLAETQDWIVGIVVAEQHYTAGLLAVRDRFLFLYAVVALAVLGAGTIATAAVRRGLRRVADATAQMRGFDFERGSTEAPFRDVQTVLESIERAKTAMRALGKYAPLDLVKELARTNVEPSLGGHPADITVMFSDIRGFTSLAERAEPHELAEWLGVYLEAMTDAVRSTGGTIDKFIGDAVMALWNAPSAVDDHPRQACRAILACKSATRALYASSRWRGRPTLVTRFGVHTDRVLVGHFGAPERMSYTALGDGVNLASRLEGLGKQYGVTALVSEPVVRAAGAGLRFRRIDKVAVKGKSAAVVVYELLDPEDVATAPPSVVQAYEEALDDYFARRFAAAAGRLAAQAEADAPSNLLLERCRRLTGDPPPESWDGVYTASSK
jgi:adenylate cyclase